MSVRSQPDTEHRPRWLLLHQLIPLSAVAAVIGALAWKLGWWVLIFGAVMATISASAAWMTGRRFRREARVDPVAARKALDERTTRWVKRFGLFMAGGLVFLGVLAIVLAATGHPG